MSWAAFCIFTSPSQKTIESCNHRSPPLDNIQVMVIVWRLRGNIISTALCWIVWQCSQSAAHLYEQFLQVKQIGFVTLDSYAVCRGGCLELYYCNMVEWFLCDSRLISMTSWFPSVLWHCWFGHLACKNRPRNDLLYVEWDVKPYTLSPKNNWVINQSIVSLLHSWQTASGEHNAMLSWHVFIVLRFSGPLFAS